MSNEFQVVFHNIDQSAALSEVVNKRIQKLQRFSNDIIGGRVVLDSPHNNHHKGKVFCVTLEIHTSGKEVIVKQGQHDKPAHEDIYVAVRDAFNAAERQLKANGKKPRKTTLAVENFEVLPEIAAEDTDELMLSDDDFTLYSPEEQDDRANYATQAA
ncbi:MAG: HPF/RaiA family ribosome-associated protein [Pseudohongiellaceae bacterium]